MFARKQESLEENLRNAHIIDKSVLDFVMEKLLKKEIKEDYNGKDIDSILDIIVSTGFDGYLTGKLNAPEGNVYWRLDVDSQNKVYSMSKGQRGENPFSNEKSFDSPTLYVVQETEIEGEKKFSLKSVVPSKNFQDDSNMRDYYKNNLKKIGCPDNVVEMVYTAVTGIAAGSLESAKPKKNIFGFLRRVK